MDKKKNKKIKPEDKVLIPVKDRTRTRLRKYKVIPRESYDGVINRSLDNTDKVERNKR